MLNSSKCKYSLNEFWSKKFYDVSMFFERNYWVNIKFGKSLFVKRTELSFFFDTQTKETIKLNCVIFFFFFAKKNMTNIRSDKKR